MSTHESDDVNPWLHEVSTHPPPRHPHVLAEGKPPTKEEEAITASSTESHKMKENDSAIMSSTSDVSDGKYKEKSRGFGRPTDESPQHDMNDDEPINRPEEQESTETRHSDECDGFYENTRVNETAKDMSEIHLGKRSTDESSKKPTTHTASIKDPFEHVLMHSPSKLKATPLVEGQMVENQAEPNLPETTHTKLPFNDPLSPTAKPYSTDKVTEKTSPPLRMNEDQEFPSTSFDLTFSPSKAGERSVYHFDIQVLNPEKIEGIVKPFVVYEVKTKTDHPQYTQRDISVLRRYRDFRWLVKQLTARYPGLIVPPVPEKQTMGRFSPDFVEYRRRALEKCLQRIGQHPILQMSHDFKVFLETNQDFDVIAGDLERETKRGFFDKLGDAVSSALNFSKTAEIDDWFDKKRLHLELLETELHALHKSLDHMAKHQKELSILSETVADCATLLRRNHTLDEDGDHLGRLLDELVDIEKDMTVLHAKQTSSETATLLATVDEYERLIISIKKALSKRLKSLEQWQSMETSLGKKRDTYEKLKASFVKGDKLMIAQRDLEEAKAKASSARNEFDDFSLRIRDELELFEQLKAKDFQKSTQEFIANFVHHQEQIVSLWEKVFLRLKPSDQEDTS